MKPGPADNEADIFAKYINSPFRTQSRSLLKRSKSISDLETDQVEPKLNNTLPNNSSTPSAKLNK